MANTESRSAQESAPQDGYESNWPASLVRDDCVHRDIYLSDAVFAAENQGLFQRAWLFVGHASQLKQPGDFITLTLAGQPIIVIRQADQTLLALANRCSHKGSPLATTDRGNTGKMLRCAYHGWSYKTSGELLAIPLRDAYAGTPHGQDSPCQSRLHRYPHLIDHRGFLFIRLADEGPSFEQWFGPALQALNNMVDRSPEGALECVGQPLRHRIRCNWKMYLENINDAMHPVSAHRSAAATAKKLWREQAAGAAMPMAVEQMLPFGSDYAFFDGMGAQILPNGHSFFGTQFNIHTGYNQVDDYTQAMQQAYGKDRTAQILGFKSQNTVFYPTLSVKSSPLAIRVLRPVSAHETILESWAFRAVGSPKRILDRSLMYNRIAFSPMSVVAHDDVHIFESMQRSLASDANPWVSLHRNAAAQTADLSAEGQVDRQVNSGNEALMRNQFKAWARTMSGLPSEASE